ncbi:hypothetical protein PLICRDRAFT_43886 [Plicaturopsis crispa FD-325 SS-3]|nr:hypothetical protein PLICRDRAFT_43886 [Plicaturopsis crispa FD-325 SS-3]
MITSAFLCLSFPVLVFSYAGPSLRSIAPRNAETTAICTKSFSWMKNERGFSPCFLAAYIVGACTRNHAWFIPRLQAGNKYDVPEGSTVNACSCSWASYNLLQACAVCQETGGFAVSWVAYQNPCSEYLSATTYLPEGDTLPNNATLPAWAGTDPKSWTYACFNASEAEALSGSSHPDLVPNSNVDNSSSSQHQISAGAIIGSVLGGFVGLVLLGLCLAFCILRKRNRDAEKIEPPHTCSVGSPGGIDDPITQTRTVSDGLKRHKDPAAVGAVDNCSGVLPANCPSMPVLSSAPSTTTTKGASGLGAVDPEAKVVCVHGETWRRQFRSLCTGI